MATKRLTMTKTKEILRHKWALGRSHREVARSLGVSAGMVGATLARASKAELREWSDVAEIDDEVLEERLYPRTIETSRPHPDCAYIHAERSKPGVTLQLLHHEYLEANPGGYQYTRFCDLYRDWLKRRRLSMRQIHKAGEKMFVDFAGQRPKIVDAKTGEVIEVELFVAVLGASSYTYAEATISQQAPQWIRAHTNALEYFGGSSRVYVPDNLKSAVTKACRYEPKIQRTYDEMARHYGAVVIPARAYKPKDKAKAEVGVQVAERWLLAVIRNETFYSITELNERLGELLEILNDKKMRTYGASRRELFERLDKPQLLPLASRFQYAEWSQCTVHIDYHVAVDGHFYSVPYELRTEAKHVEARATAFTIEVFAKGRRVASHARSYDKGGCTTIPEHMPKAHRAHMEWTPTRMINWASKIGPNTEGLVTVLLNDRPHPEQGYRSCHGILRLAKEYSDARLEAACGISLSVRARSYRHVASVLKNGLDRVDRDATQTSTPVVHENIRGGGYYN
jgi:transposase